MSPTAESSFMTTLIPVFLGGVISALVTLLLGQPLQYYFWRRQRHAEWQRAVIEDVNKLTAETQFLLMGSGAEEIQARNERLSLAMSTMIANVRALFSPPNAAYIQQLHPIIADALRLPAGSSPEQRNLLATRLMQAHHLAMIALYKDIGIPAHPHKDAIALYQTMGIADLSRWQRIRGCVYVPLRQAWCERWWPTLQRWEAQARTRIRRR